MSWVNFLHFLVYYRACQFIERDRKSFGVVALETIMGRHPRELISSLSNPTSQNMLKDILDSRLPLPYFLEDTQDITLLVTIALACLCSKPKLRPSMQHVVEKLRSFKLSLPVPFHETSIHQLMTEEQCCLSSNSQEWYLAGKKLREVIFWFLRIGKKFSLIKLKKLHVVAF